MSKTVILAVKVMIKFTPNYVKKKDKEDENTISKHLWIYSQVVEL